MTENINIEKHSEETVHMILMTKAKQLDIKSRCFGNGSLECSNCRHCMYQDMFDSLSFEELKSVKNEKSHVPFKFGDERIINSYETVSFPAKSSNCLCNIKTEVVECKILLLLRKESLAKTEEVIDIGKDHVIMFDLKENIQTTSTGHYCVNIMRNDKENTYDENVILVVDSNIARCDKRNTLLKLHKQFGHSSLEKLLNLLKTAGMIDQETKYLLKDIYIK